MSKKHNPEQGIIIDIVHFPNLGTQYRCRPKAGSVTIGDYAATHVLGICFREYLRKLPEDKRTEILAEIFPKVKPEQTEPEAVEDRKEVQP